eukprot:s1331_g16.t1
MYPLPCGFEDVMTCMEEAMPHVARRDFEDAWAKVLHVLTCARYWVGAGYGQPWACVVLCRLESLLHYGIWGAIALDLEPHSTRAGHCLVPARYKKVTHGKMSTCAAKRCRPGSCSPF